MIGRSVPLLGNGRHVGEMAAAQLTENQVVYDLGCSLGRGGLVNRSESRNTS